MAKKRKRSGGLLILFLLIAVAGAFFAYRLFFGGKVHFKDKNYAYFYIGSHDSYEDVMHHLEEEGLIESSQGANWLAKKMNLPENIHPGRYRVTEGMNVRQIINLLKYNRQEKIKLSLNSQIRNLDDFVRYTDDKLELGEDELLEFIHDEEALSRGFGLDPDNALAMLVPGVIETGWAVSLKEFTDLLSQRYKKVWNAERLAKCKKIGFTPAEVSTIASIVQSESAIASEQSKIAGVYINRLKLNMPLQADPTLKFANQNFDVLRVLDADKQVNSPYNTYRYKGLPPGPICLVGTQAIDATLNYARHRYLYFCARPQLNGYSDYSVTYEEHRRYAAAYQKALDRIGISR